MRAIINQDRAEAIVGRVMNQLERGLPPFDDAKVILPQEPSNLPPSLPSDGRLRTVCFWMRGGIPSIQAVRRVGDLYELRPDIFEIKVAAEMEPEEVVPLLEECGLQFLSSQIKLHWITNAQRLLDVYGKDTRSLFAGVENFDEACRRVCNRGKTGLWGYQEKMTSMLIYYLTCDGLIDPFPYPPPVDFHFLRIFLSTRALVVKDAPPDGIPYCREIADPVRQFLMEHSVRSGLGPEDLAAAFWLYGSNMCAYNVGNGTRQGKYGARSTDLSAIPVTWSKGQRGSHDSHCGICPLAGFCDSNWPSAYYFRKGVFFERGPRPQPPPTDPQLFVPIP